VASVQFMRPSLRKGAHAALSSAAWQEIRVRFGRDDKEGGVASIYVGKIGWTRRNFSIPIVSFAPTNEPSSCLGAIYPFTQKTTRACIVICRGSNVPTPMVP
jgi:hypothetical protein